MYDNKKQIKGRNKLLKVTIRDVAEYAGVSIATVSHVLNRTRYVNPELIERVEKAVLETGYQVRSENKQGHLRIGKQSKMAFLTPHMSGTLINQIIGYVNDMMMKQGYSLAVFITNDMIEIERELLTNLLADKNIAGIFCVPSKKEDKIYRKVKKAQKPFVCVERGVEDPDIPGVLAHNEHAIYLGTRHLIRNGHERIGILLENSHVITEEECVRGYMRALKENDLEPNPIYMLHINSEDEKWSNIFSAFSRDDFPTAMVACTNTLTYSLLNDIKMMGLNCPEDISVVGFGDDMWGDISDPPLTILTKRTEQMARQAVDIMMRQISGIPYEKPIERVPIDFRVRKSTRVINRGPFGEVAFSPDQLYVSEQDAEILREKCYKVALTFHNTNTYWSSLQEKAIRDTLSKYDVQVISVMDANYDPKLQIAQLNALKYQNPDAIIAVAVNEDITAQRFKTLSGSTKLVFIGNLPRDFSPEDYSVCVSCNERENGQNAGIILGEYFNRKEHVNIGLLVYGIPFQMTQQRDESAEQIIRDNYPNLNIVEKMPFYNIKNAYEACKELLKKHPEIEGLYVSWERPALEVIRALEELGRTDISIVTVDLDIEIAGYMMKGEMIRGLSAQRPYEIGQAAAHATIQALLGKEDFKYVEIQPVRVYPHELPKMWNEILKTSIPDNLFMKAT